MTDAMTSDPDRASPARPEHPSDQAPPSESIAAPYLVTAALATVVLLVLAAYLWLYRAEIIAILTHSPT